MDELKEKYITKNEEMKEKYQEAIIAVSRKHSVDLGVAFDMLKAVCRGADYADGIDYDKEGFLKDYLELAEISEKIAGK